MQSDHLSLTFTALADPTRRSIVTRLAEGEATERTGEPFAVSLPAISRHLKVLERAGLSSAGARPSGGPAGCRLSRSKRRWNGCSRASGPGKPGWTDWTRICAGKERKGE